MPESLSRRRFLTRAGAAILVGGVATTLGPRAASEGQGAERAEGRRGEARLENG